MIKDRIERREKLRIQLQDKRYRDAFVSEYIDAGIAFQIRALRKREEWTQIKLAEQTGMAQERISVAENPNYSRFNIKTLKRIASAFDVALIVRFVPVSELVNWELGISSETLAPVRFDKDPYFKPSVTHIGGQVGIVNFINPSQPSIPSPFEVKSIDELSKYREAKQRDKQKESKSQLQRFMGMEKQNETAIG